MSLEKKVEIDKIEIIEYSIIQIREKTTIFDNGKEISTNFRRWVISPGMDYSQETEKVKSICNLLHTEDVINEYQEFLEKNKLP